MRIARPDDLTDLATLGLTLAEGKQLLAGVQQELVAAQARRHAVRRPACRSCSTTCRVKDYRQHARDRRKVGGQAATAIGGGGGVGGREFFPETGAGGALLRGAGARERKTAPPP